MAWNYGSQIVDWLMNEGVRVDPNQPDREVYENGVEAGATVCTFFGFDGESDAGDPRHFKAHADDGTGMDSLKHLDYLGTLFNTGAAKTTASVGADKNKGVGARIASLARNPEGVDFYSRTEAEKKAGIDWHMVRLLPTGPKAWSTTRGPAEIVDADPAEVAQIEVFLPKSFGTVVVFRGDGSADTWTEEAWKATYKYMQQRYLTFPAPLKLDGRGLPSMIGRAKASNRYDVDALSDYYDKHTGHLGMLTLTDGTEIEWYVFDHTARGVSFDAIQTKGVAKGRPVGEDMPTGPSRTPGFRGVAMFDKNELFEHSGYRPSFGLIGKATRRVSLIITPPTGTALQSTNRQRLEPLAGGEWDYVKWGSEFIDNMPPEIQALMESDWQATDTITAADLDLLDPDWYKRITAKTMIMVDPEGKIDVEDPENVVAREGSGGKGHIVDPDPHPRPGDEDGDQPGDHHSADRQRARRSTRTSTLKGTEGEWTAFDLEVAWLPDKSTTGGPTWTSQIPDTPTTADVRDRGWAYYPDVKTHKIYLRETGDPFQKTLQKFRDAHPIAHAPKVWKDVKDAYAMEAIAKVVHIRDGLEMLWSDKDVAAQFQALHLSAALTGLNSVEDTIRILLRKTSAPKKSTKKKGKP